MSRRARGNHADGAGVATWTVAGLLGLLAGLWLWAGLALLLDGFEPGSARPWSAFQWVLDPSSSPVGGDALRDAGTMAGLLAVAVAVALMGPDRERPHGDARFARAGELRRAGLRAGHGLVLGKVGRRFLVHRGQTHVLVTAPTGAGKGVGLVIPNLLSWPGSAVVLDVKGENFAATAGYRAGCGQRVVNFAPLSERSHRFNPFDAVKDAAPERRITLLEAMALTLLPDPDSGDRVWAQQGRALFVGLALVVLDVPDREATLGSVLRHLQTEAATTDVCRGLLARYRARLDPVAVRNLANFAHLEPKIAESVKLGLVGALTLWNNPLVDAATSATDFAIDRLRREPTTVYIGAQLPDLKGLAPLLRLFVEQVFAAQLRSEPGPDEPHQVLLLLDEFEALGTMPSIVDNLPFVRSFGVRVMIIVQGLTQLDLRYRAAGREKILQASAHQVFFALNDRRTTDYVTYRLGRRTVRQNSRSVSSGRTTRNSSQTGRDLLMPQEVAQLPADTEIVLVEGHRPVRARKIVYYRDPALRSRAHRPSPPVPALQPVAKTSPTLPDVPDAATARARKAHTGGTAGSRCRPRPSGFAGGRASRGGVNAETKRDIDGMVSDLEALLEASVETPSD